MPRYRALLTDLDGVLRSWPANDDAFEQPFGLPPGSIASVAFDDARLLPAITGVIFRAQRTARLSPRNARGPIIARE